MSFQDDLNLEEKFFNELFKHYLISNGYNFTWIYYDETNMIYKDMQKKHDIDIILDDGKKNISLSLKTVRNNYDNIFFETVSNCNTGTKGWGYYSKADFVIYTFGYPDNDIISYAFETKDVLKLDLEKYPIRHGKTEKLYETEGRLIPILDIDNIQRQDYRELIQSQLSGLLVTTQ